MVEKIQRFIDIANPIKPHDHRCTPGKCWCGECRKTLSQKSFYKTTREEFKDGYLPFCKTCINMTLDDRVPNNFLRVLSATNTPYIPHLWRELLDQKQPDSGPILGKYLIKLSLPQFANNDRYSTWDKTFDIIQDEWSANSAQYVSDGMDVEEAKDLAWQEITLQDFLERPKEKIEIEVSRYDDGSLVEIGNSGLSKEDIQYLKLKWGDEYTIAEYEKLEHSYGLYKQTYNLQDPIAQQYVESVIKSHLKLQQAMAANDYDGITKFGAIYDKFLKSLNLQPLQNKDRLDSQLSLGEVFYLAEKNGEIPKYDPFPTDDVFDAVIIDMQKYVEKLVGGIQGLEDRITNSQNVFGDISEEEKRGEISVKILEEFENEIRTLAVSEDIDIEELEEEIEGEDE